MSLGLNVEVLKPIEKLLRRKNVSKLLKNASKFDIISNIFSMYCEYSHVVHSYAITIVQLSLFYYSSIQFLLYLIMFFCFQDKESP